MLDLIIAELVNVPSPRMACITAQMMGVAARCDCIIALLSQQSAVHSSFGRHLETIKALRNDSGHPNIRRNRIVHDPWYIDVGTSTTAQQKSMPRQDKNYSLQYGIKDVDKKEIEETLDQIQRLTERVGRLRADLLDDLNRQATAS
jgi:hypothetical protein